MPFYAGFGSEKSALQFKSTKISGGPEGLVVRPPEVADALSLSCLFQRDDGSSIDLE